MQADRSRTGGMFHAPKSSPWGEVQNCETLCPGSVFGIYRQPRRNDGGKRGSRRSLPSGQKNAASRSKGYICYEEDAQESVVLRELLDKKAVENP